MNVLALLKELETAGVALLIDDNGELRMRGRGPRRSDLIDQVRRMKTEILRVLSTNGPPNVTDWRTYFDERAAIAEHDGRLSRAKAERLAAFYCRQVWYEQNPPPDPGAGQCCHCGHHIAGSSRTISAGWWTRWLHAECEAPFASARRQAAGEALAAVNVCCEDRNGAAGTMKDPRPL